MGELKKLRAQLVPDGEIAAANCADQPGLNPQLARLCKVREAAARIVEALESDEVLEQAALQLAWSELLERLIHGDGEEFKDTVTQIQKLCASSRGRKRRRKDPRQTELDFTRGVSRETLQRIEEALALL